MPVFLKNSAAAVLLVFATALYGCGEDSINETCPPLPDLISYHALWVNADTLEVFYRLEEASMHTGERVLERIIGKMFISETPTGPWSQLAIDTLHGRGYDSSRTYCRIENPDRLHFIRLDFEYECQGENDAHNGPMIATRRPVSHPDSWEAGPTLVSPVKEVTSARSGTAISEDGTKILAGHREGRIFNLATGEDITPFQSITKIIELGSAGKWQDSLLYAFGRTFGIYNTNTREELLGVVGNFAYPKDDTSYVVHNNVNNRLLHYNTLTKTLHIVEIGYVNTSSLFYTTSSPTYGFIGSYQENSGTPNYRDYVLLYPNYDRYRLISPFGMTATNRQMVRYGVGLQFPFIQWGKDDDRIFFWSAWTGSQEIWTYSIASNEYKQITGYQRRYYPGTYINQYLETLATLNFIYDHTKNRLSLFFRRDPFSYAMRYIPVSEL